MSGGWRHGEAGADAGERKEHHRSKIASFLASFKSALALLTG